MALTSTKLSINDKNLTPKTNTLLAINDVIYLLTYLLTQIYFKKTFNAVRSHTAA